MRSNGVLIYTELICEPHCRLLGPQTKGLRSLHWLTQGCRMRKTCYKGFTLIPSALTSRFVATDNTRVAGPSCLYDKACRMFYLGRLILV
jgi:hypothetical protein